MSNAHALHVLKVAVAQICQTIGWHSAHSTTMELLVDVTQHFLREISRIMHRYTELYNRTEPNLDDLAMAYKDMGINLQEVMEYIQFVDPIPLALAVRRFPIPKDSQLSFMKPGSKEVLTRPVHIPEHMPPIFLEVENDDPGPGALINGEKLIGDAETYGTFQSSEAAAVGAALAIGAPNMVKLDDRQQCGNAPMLTEEATMLVDSQVNAEIEIPMQTIETKDPTALTARTDSVAHSSYDNPTGNPPDMASSFNVLETETVPATVSNTVAPGQEKESVVKNTINAPFAAEGRPTREISSVIMTTSGFISPARAGKLPESCIPFIREERPPKPSSGAALSVSSSTSTAVTAMLPVPPVGTAIYGDTNNSATADGVSSVTQHYAAGRKARKKPIDKQRKKSLKKATTVASQPTGSSQPHFTGKKNDTVTALKPTAAPSEFADYGELAHGCGALNTATETKALTYLKTTVPESSISEAQLTPSTLPKATKEKTSKKRKTTKQMQSPTKRTSAQVTAPLTIGLGNVQPKEKAAKRRSKMSKKNLAQRVKDESFLEAAAATPAVPPPLIGPLGLSGASAPGPLLVAPPPTTEKWIINCHQTTNIISRTGAALPANTNS
ncbi:transcription initiation factor TFIID subunit 3-like [Anopheles cruzii]|uniref:transcription initiation factor TFIID subunit 3-like n=1 Tax=Anopheles cruzii TaxID=68878 RepID=UPI0022EC7FB7|nr:transcription initiation factor TFIID subunit 3-like [Anopheles cruzii]